MTSHKYSAFFYGTLLHPFILRRVIGHSGDDLQICPALLLEHTRHQIKLADYPGVIPYEKTRKLLESNGKSPDLPPDERTVRGTLVKGLSKADVDLLDVFEGDEYSREVVSVHPLEPLTPLSSSPGFALTVPPAVPDLSTIASKHPPVQANTYIWTQPLDELRPDVWEFSEFVRTNAWKWVGDSEGVQQNKDYLEVDKRREMGGVIIRREIVDEAETGEKKVVVEIEA